MLVIPAIDILGGKCVRLARGRYDSAAVYDGNPPAVARRFVAAGATRLHIVDLDAARAGRAVNVAVINEILALAQTAGVAVQVGGGLRDEDGIRRILTAGAAFAVLGSRAVEDENFRRAVVREFAGRIIFSLDSNGEQLAVSGWQSESSLTIDDFLESLDAQPAAMVYTDIRRDGMLQGANIEQTRRVAARADCPLIASGGVSSLDDLQKLAECGVFGAIIGRAIYSGDIKLAAALKFNGEFSDGFIEKPAASSAAPHSAKI